MTAAHEPPHGYAPQTCAGIGWVSFDQARDPQSLSESFQAPEFRCFGLRLAQQLGQGAEDMGFADAGAQHRASKMNSRSIAAEDESDREFSPVPEQTLKLFCAGQLSMITPRLSSAGSQLSFGNGSPELARSAHSQPPREPCFTRCVGFCVRLDAINEAQDGNDVDAQPNMEEENAITAAQVVENAYSGAQHVGQRVEAIAKFVGGYSARQTWRSPQQLTADTTRTLQRICNQSAKITQRSGKFLGQAASYPFSE